MSVGARRARSIAILGIVCLCLVSALAIPGTAVGLGRTTGPSKVRYVYLIMTDKSISFHNDDLTLLTRGSYLRFFVFNFGKVKHQLEVLGKKTPVIKPGERGQTPFIYFSHRGTYRFFDPSDPRLSGTFEVL